MTPQWDINPASASLPPESRLVRIAAGLFTPAVFFVSAPNNIILGNLLDIPYDVGTVGMFLSGFVLSVLLTLPLFWVRAPGRLRRAATRAWLLAGVCVLCFDLLSAVLEPAVPSLAGRAAVDVLVLLVFAPLLHRAPFALITRVFGGIAVVILVHGVGSHGYTLGRRALAEAARQRLAQEAQSQSIGMTDVNKSGNTYHIILDAFQTEAFLLLAAQEPGLRLAGFTQYTEFTAHYARTNHSVPNMLAGRFYKEGESMWEWREAAMGTGGLWGSLAAGGVDLHLYPYYPPYCTPVAQTCADTITYAESFRGPSAAKAPRDVVIDLWFLGLLPSSLRTVVNRPFVLDPAVPRDGAHMYGFSITSLVMPETQTNSAARPGVPDFTHGPAYSVRHFDIMLREEATRPARGQYVFFHSLVPHWPFVVNETCAYTGVSRAPPLDAYMAQVRCAMRLIEQLTARLRELGRYEDALIVIHADHGGKGGAVMVRESPDTWPGPQYGGELDWPNGDRVPSADWPHHLVDLYRRALLLVKYPGHQEFTTSVVPAQTIDLAPTILQHMGVAHAEYPGVPLPELSPTPDRDLVFFASNTRPSAHVPAVFSEYVLEEGTWRHRADVATAP